MYKMCAKLIIVRTVIFLWPIPLISALLTNTSAHSRRSAEGSTDILNRQYPPFDMSFILPHLIVGVLIPIAVIIGIGVVLMKLFIIGFMLLGRGGYGLTPSLSPSYPWRVEQQQIQRSLGKDGSLASNYLSQTLWKILTTFSNSFDKYQKSKI